MSELNFYKGKRVFVTGHTGFKGSWLCAILINQGAIVTGYSLQPPTEPNLFQLSGLENKITSIIGDVRDYSKLQESIEIACPDVIFHLAAQPIVREGYAKPRDTYEINVMGTVNVLEAARYCSNLKSIVVITTDKVYKNNEWVYGYRENDILNGYDPYSNSKSCSELITETYRRCFFDKEKKLAISSVRAGNVIGGGDFAKNRIIPDCVRAAIKGENIEIRNPNSIRPYQHVLEPLFLYLKIAEVQYFNYQKSGCYNVGPDESDCIKTCDLVNLFCTIWKGVTWCEKCEEAAPHEAGLLKLDCSKLKEEFEWRPVWKIDRVMELTCQFYKVWSRSENIYEEMIEEIEQFEKDRNKLWRNGPMKKKQEDA